MGLNLASTEIGSLPTIHTDAALAHAFSTSIPFFPQLPQRSPREFMIAQALDGLPGLTIDADGSAQIDSKRWNDSQPKLAAKLDADLAHALSPFRSPALLEGYEPRSESASCWRAFLFECEERKVRRAKIQIVGPVTVQWAVNAPDLEELASTLVRFVLLRSLAMAHALQARGIEPILFLDEPGLAMWQAAQPTHRALLQELATVITTLKRQEITVGLHCCGQTAWNEILNLPMDWLSIDAGLSGTVLAQHRTALDAFFERGGKLALGLVPTQPGSTDRPIWQVPDWMRPRIAALTPACGLALLKVTEADAILEKLLEVSQHP